MCTTVYPAPDWATIRTVLLDMDGTLLDRAFDDHFYLEALPAHYAAANRMPVEAARERLVALYRAVEGELDWTDVDYWARTLDLDVPAFKDSLRHRIAPHPDSLAFLTFLRKRMIPVHLVERASQDVGHQDGPDRPEGVPRPCHHCVRRRLPQIQGGLLGQVGGDSGIRSLRD